MDFQWSAEKLDSLVYEYNQRTYQTSLRDLNEISRTKYNRGASQLPFLLLPHGAYGDSGPLVGDALQTLGKFWQPPNPVKNTKDNLTVIIVGTEHRCTAKTFISTSNFAQWNTPLGNVEVDSGLYQQLVYRCKRANAPFSVENKPLLQEHSIENQLPFLQGWIGQDLFKILPISVKSVVQPEDQTEFTSENGVIQKIVDLISEGIGTGKRFLLVGTTDYSHVGPAYGFVPPGWPNSTSIPDFIRQLDLPLLQGVCGCGCSGGRFLNSTSQPNGMCGRGAAAVALEIKRRLSQRLGQGDPEVKLLRYTVGSDIGQKHNDQTGFASMMAL